MKATQNNSYDTHYNSNNIFAKILKGELPCDKIYENDAALAFYDKYPQAKIHVLVIPKIACVDFTDFMQKSQPQASAEFFLAVNKTIEILGLEQNGYRLVANSGENAGQLVPHFHIHILGGEKLHGHFGR